MFSFSSCIVPVDLRDRAIVQIMGIDFEKDRYKIILQEYAPQKKDSGENSGEANVVVSYGKTLYDALKNAESTDGKQIFYGQCRIFVIGKEALEKGIEQITDFMNTNYQLSLNSSVLAAENSAEEILNVKTLSKSMPSLNVSRLEGCGKTVDTRVLDVLKMYNHKGAGTLPRILKKDKENVIIENAVVLKDLKQDFTLNSAETIGLNFLKSEISDAVLTVELENKNVSVAIVSQSAKTSLGKIGDKYVYSVSISAEGNISENMIINRNSMKDNTINAVESSVSEQIEEYVLSCLDKIIKQEKTDIFFLLSELKKIDKNAHNTAKESDDWLSQIEFDVSVNFKVRHSGIQVK